MDEYICIIESIGHRVKKMGGTKGGVTNIAMGAAMLGENKS